MSILLRAERGLVAVGVEDAGHLESFFEPAQADAQVARLCCRELAAAGKRGRLALGRVLLGLWMHARPDVDEGPKGMEGEQAQPTGHMDRLRLRVVPLVSNLVWQVVDVDERVENEREPGDQDHE